MAENRNGAARERDYDAARRKARERDASMPKRTGRATTRPPRKCAREQNSGEDLTSGDTRPDKRPRDDQGQRRREQLTASRHGNRKGNKRDKPAAKRH